MSFDYAWVPHEELVWTPARLRSCHESKVVYITDDDMEVTIKPEEQSSLAPVTGDQLLGVSNLVTLSVVTPAAVLHAVRTRYSQKDIYTHVARIVIAVNPFQPLNIYTKENMDLYSRAADTLDLPPHVFSIGANAFEGLQEDQQNQAILVSGESGAGKTESTKLILSYLAHVSGNDKTTIAAGIEEKLLQTNPVLEAFGNAKTRRNDNSSRFGKWTEVVYHPSMRIIGSRINDYLLEMPRVCCVMPGERNYHVFYHLLAGNTDPKLELAGVSDYRYLSASSPFVDGMDDANLFENLKRSLSALQFSTEEQNDIFSIVAGVLHLGNLDFKNSDAFGEDGSELVCDEAALKVCRVLGLDIDMLKLPLMWRRIVVNGETTDSPLTPLLAKAQRDALAKLIYGKLFKWLISRLNATMSTAEIMDASSFKYIGILDIAGFEQFKINSLEQLFINLSNEVLQKHFNTHIFMQELDDYKAEGIIVDNIQFHDNNACVELLSGKNGILDYLDEELCIPRSTDRTYTDRLWKNFGEHTHFEKSRFTSTSEFSIAHFAGTVTYTVDGWLEKNCDDPSPCFNKLLGNSTLSILREAIVKEKTQEATKTTGRMKKVAVSQGFRSSLNNLISKISEAAPHFIRCIKPNRHKSAFVFESVSCMEQLMFSGIMEAVKIRQAGYPLRMKFLDFNQRYACTLDQLQRRTLPKIEADIVLNLRANIIDIVSSLTRDVEVSASDVAVGQTKVLLKQNAQTILEEHRRTVYRDALICLQRRIKMFAQRNIFLRARAVFRSLDAWIHRNMAQMSSDMNREARKQLEELREQANKCSPVPPNLPRAMNVAAIMELGDSFELTEIKSKLENLSESGPMVDALTDRVNKLAVQLPLVRMLEGLDCTDPKRLQELERAVTKCECAVPDRSIWLSDIWLKLLETVKAWIGEMKTTINSKDDDSDTTADGDESSSSNGVELMAHTRKSSKGAGKVSCKGVGKGPFVPGGKGVAGKVPVTPCKGAGKGPCAPSKGVGQARTVDKDTKCALEASRIAWAENLNNALYEYDVSTIEAIMREAPREAISKEVLAQCAVTLQKLGTESFLATEVRRITSSSSGEFKRLHNLSRQWADLWHRSKS